MHEQKNKFGYPIPMPPSTSLAIGYHGTVGLEDRDRLPYAKLMLNYTTQSGFLEDT